MSILAIGIVVNIVFGLGIIFWFLFGSRSKSAIGVFSVGIQQVVTFVSYFLPNFMLQVIRSVYVYLFFTRNSFFQILYLFLVVTIHVSVINDGLAIVTHVDPEASHLFLPFLILGINFTFFVICCYSNPGVITKENVYGYLTAFQYDGQMYQKNSKCTTCHLVKPARSKHCSVYNRCIFKFDHYCIWIRNCVGGLNHRYFLLLLLSLTVMCVHGSLATLKVLRAIIQVSNFWNTSYISGAGQSEPMTLIVVTKILCRKFPRLMLIELSLILLSFVVGYFTVYHLSFAMRNETTNERYKRQAIRKSGSRCGKNIYDKGILENFREELFPFKLKIPFQKGD